MPRPAEFENWHLEAINVMAQTGCSLVEAATQLGQEVSYEQANKLLRRVSFQRLLWEARHRYFSTLGGDPEWKKESAIGKLLVLASKLEEDGQHDKAAEVIFKIAKMSGWVGPDSTVNVFGDLSDKDLKTIREQISKSPTKLGPSTKVN